MLDSGSKGVTGHRRVWEAATLLALRERLRAGDIWVEGSRQWRAVEDQLIPPALFTAMREAGDVILVTFNLAGQSFQALNGGTPADYGTAASISVRCADQAEVDRLWAALTADGRSEIMCGWLRDRWGIPWQIVPEALPRLLADPDPAVSGRVFAAMVNMVKLDIATLERAAVG